MKAMTERKSLYSASPYEEQFGFCRGLRVGNVVQISGTAPIGENGETVGVGDLAAQARRCLEIIERSLNALGAGLGDVVRTRLYLTDIADWKTIGAVHGEYFADSKPVSTMVAVSRLVDADWCIEIEAEALIDHD